MALYFSITGTPTEVITLAEAKMQLRVDAVDEDALITNLIIAARQAAENYIGRFIAERTVTLESNNFVNDFNLVYTPVVEILSIKYLDENKATQTLNPSKYHLVKNNLLDSIIKYDDNLPSIYNAYNAVTIQLTSGFSAMPNGGVPQDIKSAMLLTITDLYQNRESRVDNFTSNCQSLLRPYRRY